MSKEQWVIDCQSGVCALPGGMERAFSDQTEGKWTDLAAVPEYVGAAEWAVQLCLPGPD